MSDERKRHIEHMFVNATSEAKRATWALTYGGELLDALDSANATLESLRLIIAPNETLEDIVRATQRTIDTVFVEIEQANEVHAKNVDLSDKLRAAQARADALAGQVAEMRAALTSWTNALCDGINTDYDIPGGWNLVDAICDTRKLLAQPPTPTEARVAAALEVADELDAWSQPEMPESVVTSVIQDALAAYRTAAKEGGDA